MDSFLGLFSKKDLPKSFDRHVLIKLIHKNKKILGQKRVPPKAIQRVIKYLEQSSIPDKIASTELDKHIDIITTMFTKDYPGSPTMFKFIVSRLIRDKLATEYKPLSLKLTKSVKTKKVKTQDTMQDTLHDTMQDTPTIHDTIQDKQDTCQTEGEMISESQ